MVTKQASSCAIKLDAPFISCMNSLSDRGTRLKPLRKEVSRKFPFGEAEYKAFFKAPSVPDAATRVGDARAKRSTSRRNPLRSPKFSMMESQLHAVDSAARGSMRLAAYQTYLLTAQREADKLNISPEDRKLISDLLLQIAELQFEQATRTSILVTRLRRSLVLEHLQIEKNAAALLQKLPVKGEDLFGGKFQEILESSITASNTADKTVYKLSAPSKLNLSTLTQR